MITVVFRTVIIYIILTVAMRIMGKRQIGELEISELIVTFMLSELATVPISDIEAPILNAIVPILILLSFEGILSYLTVKIPLFKKAIYGKPSILIKEGIIDQNELAAQRIELSELMCAIRQSGISAIENVFYAILEENGKISVFPKASEAPVTPSQLKRDVKAEGVGLPIIMDRRIIKENMKLRNWDEKLIHKELKNHKLTLEDVFLLTVDDLGHVYIIKKEENK